MRSREERQGRLATARLYCCTDSHGSVEEFGSFVEALFAAGVDIVQFRDKVLEPRLALPYIDRLRDAALQFGALACVNDRADLARISGVDIVHVGQDDLTPAQARTIVGPDLLIGRSTHALVEAQGAAADVDVDYFAVGPVWPTPTKQGRHAPGLGLVREVAALEPAKPWFAIGGIDASRLAEVREAGASRIVVVRALTAAADPAAATRELLAGL